MLGEATFLLDFYGVASIFLRLRLIGSTRKHIAMHYQHITYEELGSVACIALSRPEAANGLNRQMGEELAHAIRHGLKDVFVRVLLITGAGERAFCAGADLKERRGITREAWHHQHEAFEAIIRAITTADKPIIAAVNGAAVGGGLEIALACDLVYAADHARFGLTEATLGIMPGMGGTQTLPRSIGTRRALEMLLTGEMIDSSTAAQYGLVNRIFSASSLRNESLHIAQRIADNAPLALKAIKQSVREGSTQPLSEALRTELLFYNPLLDSHDRNEGINAFNEKRKPNFTGS